MSLLLRTCRSDMTSHAGFRWPRPDEDLGHGLGVAVVPDWDPTPTCGGGLHGLPDGQGDWSLLDWSPDAVWMVAEPVGPEWVDLGGKVKVRAARAVFAGDHPGALAALRAAGVTGALPGDTATAGDRGTATAGYWGTATAGYEGTIALRRWDGRRWRLVVGYIGEGLLPNQPYRLDAAGNFVEAQP